MKFDKREISVSNQTYSVIGCSVTGKDKTENQDSFNIYNDDSQIIVTVADGLGSAIFSKEGSSKIVKIAAELLAKSDSLQNLPLELLRKWKNSIEENLNLYDTTIKFIKIKDNTVFYGGIGDGWIAIKTDSNYYSLTAENVFSNQTESILSFDLKKKFNIGNIYNEKIRTILIATDGFSEDICKERGGDFLKNIEKEIMTNQGMFEQELKKTLNEWPVINADDKTVVIIQNKGEKYNE